MQQSKFQKVLEILMQQGLTDEQIAKFCEAVAREGFAHLMETAAETFSQEDLAQVEACKSQEEADETIKKLFTERTGRNAGEEMQKYIDTYSDGFLEEREKQKAAPSSS